MQTRVAMARVLTTTTAKEVLCQINESLSTLLR